MAALRRGPSPARRAETEKRKRAAGCPAALVKLFAKAVSKRNLLEVGHRRQVEREFGDTGGAAPVGADAGRVDVAEAAVGDRGVVAGEGIAVRLRQVGVGVT